MTAGNANEFRTLFRDRPFNEQGQVQMQSRVSQ